MDFRFLQQLSKFLQWLSDFSQQLSAFREIRENLFMARSIQKIAIRALYFLPLAPRASWLPINNTYVITQQDRGTNTLTSCGPEEPFFHLCCCVSFMFWWEIGFGCTYYYVITVPYSCGVLLVFWFWWEIVFGVTYVLSVQYSCAVVLFLLLWRES